MLSANNRKQLLAKPAHAQAGFTLIELLITLVLGLLISAAALQIFYTSSVNASRQQAGSQIQDNAIFGLSDLKLRLRRANYGAQASSSKNQFYMNHLTPQGGVVLTAPTGKVTTVGANGNALTSVGWANSNLYGLKLNGAAISKALLSANAAASSASNLADSDVANSDQLTIQYQAGRKGVFDCQGRAVPQDYYVIERYFVRSDTSVSPARYGLACASAIYRYDAALAGGSEGIDIKQYLPPGETKAKKNNLTGNGMIVVPNVDYFRVLLGVSSSDDFAVRPEEAAVAYIPIPGDPSQILANKRIVSIQLGLLTHSDSATSTAQVNSQLSFDILDKRNKALNSAAESGPTYLRNVYEISVLFRNARGGV